MNVTFSKFKLCYLELFLLSTVLMVLVLLVVGYSQKVSTNSAETVTDEFQMKLDPDCIEVAPVAKIPEINIVSRQSMFFKNERDTFAPEENCGPLIINTCDQALHDMRVIWHIPDGRYRFLPEGAANFMELCEAIDELDVLDSRKSQNQGNFFDVTPSTLLPGHSAPITTLSNGVRKRIDESGFAKGQLYVTANASNGLVLRMVYGFELEPNTTSSEGLHCRIVELLDIGTNQTLSGQ